MLIEGAEDTAIPLGTRFQTASNIVFETIESGDIPASGMLTLDARAVDGGSNGNVADDTVFTLVTAITGVTTLTAEGAFARGDDVSGGRRLFTATQFVAASPDEYLYRWVPVGPNEHLETVVGPDPATGVLRPVTAEDFDAQHGQSAIVAFDGTDFQRASRRVISGQSASGTWTEVPDATDITGTNKRWRQTHWQDYLVSNPAANDVYFNRTQGFREYDGSNWHSVGTSAVFTSEDVEYLGAFNTEAQATDFATKNGQWALIETGGAPIMHSLSGHTPASPEHYEYFWTPVNPPDHFPGPLTANADQLMRFDTTTAAWTARDLVTGDSIDGIGTQGDPLVVNTHDVIERLAEHVRYFHGGAQDATDRGSTVCQVYVTGPYQYGVTHIRVGIDAPATGAHYRGRLYTLQDNNVIAAKLADTPERAFSTGGQSHYLYFDSHGVTVEDNTRIAVCVSRTRVSADTQTRLYFGAEDADSPEVSYPDADEDFDLRGWAQYTAVDPAVGNSTHAHDTDGNATIHGNIEIYYTRTVNHGHLVGDGNVDLDHLNADVTARLLPASPNDDQIARYDSSASAWVAEDLPAGGDGDITEVSPTAEGGLAGGAVSGPARLRLAFDTNLPRSASPAYDDAADLIPVYNDDEGHEIALTLAQLKAELASVTVNPSGVATQTAQKIEVGGAVYNAGPARIFTSGVTYTADFNATVVIAAAGYTPAVGDIVIFQHNTNVDANYLASEAVRLDVGDEAAVRTRIEDRGQLRDMIMTDLVRYEWMAFVRAGSFWHLLFRTYKTNSSTGARAVRTGNLTIASDTVTAVPMNSQSFDDCDCWESSASTRMTIHEGVTRAKIWAGVGLSSPAASNDLSVYIRRNGTDYIAMNADGNVLAGGTNRPAVGLSAATGLIDVSDGQYFELVVYSASGVTLVGSQSFLAIEVH